MAQWIQCLPVNQRSPVQFPVRVHDYIVGQAPSRECMRGNHTLMFLYLSPSLPLSLKIMNK